MNPYFNSFTIQVVISAMLLAVCLTNIVIKTDSSLQWEKALIASIFAYWITPPTQKK